MSFYQKNGALIFGTRLKRLSDKYLQDVSRLYKSLDLPFEPAWFPVFYLVNERTTVTMTEIANELKITHSAVSQLVNMLKNKNLLDFVKADEDKRKILICFSKEGQKLTEKLLPVWQSLRRIMEDILKEGKYSENVLNGLDEIEAKFEEKGLIDRVMDDINRYSTKGIKTISYKPEYKSTYKKLMFPWLVNNYQKDNVNLDIINQPLEKFISKGNNIYLSKIKDDVVAVAVCQFLTTQIVEIIYLGVDKEWEWRNIGNQLLKDIIEDLGKTKLRTLKIELLSSQFDYKSLYLKNGFKVIEEKEDTLQMELNLRR